MAIFFFGHDDLVAKVKLRENVNIKRAPPAEPSLLRVHPLLLLCGLDSHEFWVTKYNNHGMVAITGKEIHCTLHWPTALPLSLLPRPSFVLTTEHLVSFSIFLLWYSLSCWSLSKYCWSSSRLQCSSVNCTALWTQLDFFPPHSDWKTHWRRLLAEISIVH